MEHRVRGRPPPPLLSPSQTRVARARDRGRPTAAADAPTYVCPTMARDPCPTAAAAQAPPWAHCQSTDPPRCGVIGLGLSNFRCNHPPSWRRLARLDERQILSAFARCSILPVVPLGRGLRAPNVALHLITTPAICHVGRFQSGLGAGGHMTPVVVASRLLPPCASCVVSPAPPHCARVLPTPCTRVDSVPPIVSLRFLQILFAIAS